MTFSETGRGRGDRPDTHPASDADDDGGRLTGRMAAMFDKLRDAAAEHDGDRDEAPGRAKQLKR